MRGCGAGGTSCGGRWRVGGPPRCALGGIDGRAWMGAELQALGATTIPTALFLTGRTPIKFPWGPGWGVGRGCVGLNPAALISGGIGAGVDGAAERGAGEDLETGDVARGDINDDEDAAGEGEETSLTWTLGCILGWSLG